MTRAYAAVLRRLVAVGLGRTAAVVVVGQLTILAVVAWYAPDLGPREPFSAAWEELVLPGGDFLGQLVSRVQRWDGLWYQHIAEAGYDAQDGSTAFLPLYPALGALVGRLAGSVALGLVVVSCVAYGVALWLIGRLTVLEAPALLRDAGGDDGTARERATTVALLAMLGIATFPTAFFFVAPFTESLFLALAVATLWFARTGRPWPAAIVAGLAVLVRTQGVVLALPLAWEALRGAGLVGSGGAPGDRYRDRLSRAVPGLVGAAVPVAALLAWYGWQLSALEAEGVGLSALSPWGYRVAAPWDALAASVGYVVERLPAPLGLVEALNLACLVGFAGLAFAARRLPVSHSLYVVPTLALYATRTMWFMPLMSVSRYALVLFPCFIALAAILERRPRVAIAWLVASALAQVVLFQYWVRWGFVA